MRLAAVIVESRPLPNLVEIIREHHLKFLPEDVQLILFHGEANYQMLKEAFPKGGFSNINGLVNTEQYNWMMTQPEFWSQLQEYDRVLIFQSDSRLLKTGIEEFYDYAMVGASWNFSPFCCNGGASLRDPKVMLKICTTYPRPVGLNEDVYYSQILHDNPHLGKIATQPDGDRFGTETRHHLGTFSCHGVEKWQSAEEIQKIYSQVK